MEQLGLSYIAGTARAAGLTAEIVDGALEPDRYDATLREMRNGDHQLIGFPIYPETVRRVAKDVAGLRARGIGTHVAVGNHLATLHDRAVLRDFPQFDSAVRGEGELTMVELAKSLSVGEDPDGVLGLTYRRGAELHRNPSRPNMPDLDQVPFPARDTLLLVLRAGNAPLIYSSRGCNFRCEFCSVHNYFKAAPNGAWRGRSPKNVVDEMEFVSRRYGVHEFAFADEQFLGHGRQGVQRALEIAAEIVRRRLEVKWYVETRASGVTYDVFAPLRQAGLSAVFMGLESGYDPALKQMRKGLTSARSVAAIDVLKELEILPSAGFIMLRPDTTMEELRYNLDFLDHVGCIELTALVTAMRVYHGTALEAQLRSEGRLSGTYYDYEWSFLDPKVRECYQVVMESADTLSVAYNEFARFRRTGLVSYVECLKLQRAMNAAPIAIMRDLVEAIEDEGGDARRAGPCSHRLQGCLRRLSTPSALRRGVRGTPSGGQRRPPPQPHVPLLSWPVQSAFTQGCLVFDAHAGVGGEQVGTRVPFSPLPDRRTGYPVPDMRARSVKLASTSPPSPSSSCRRSPSLDSRTHYARRAARRPAVELPNRSGVSTRPLGNPRPACPRCAAAPRRSAEGQGRQLHFDGQSAIMPAGGHVRGPLAAFLLAAGVVAVLLQPISNPVLEQLMLIAFGASRVSRAGALVGTAVVAEPQAAGLVAEDVHVSTADQTRQSAPTAPVLVGAGATDDDEFSIRPRGGGHAADLRCRQRWVPGRPASPRSSSGEGTTGLLACSDAIQGG